MDIAFLQPILEWIGSHPKWSSFIVFLITFTESVAVFGFFVPGVLLLFGVGALVAVGTLDLWVTLVAAATGALLGDLASYWMGHHFKERLRFMWPLSRYPGVLTRGETFFHRHGGKSVVLGRFVGPIRAIVPAIAGMVGMPLVRFIVIDTLAAIAWAPAYILPGVVFAASLGLAAQVATRLAVLLVVFAALLWLTVWLVRRVVAHLQARANSLIMSTLQWSRRHRFLGGVATAVLDPYQSESRGLLLFACILIGVTLALGALIAAVTSPIPQSGVDYALLSAMRELRTPLADRFMSLLSRLGDAPVTVVVIAMVVAWWAWRRNWPAIVHCASALGFGVLLVVVYYGWLARLQGPAAGLGAGERWVWSHPVMAAMCYGFVSVVVARELSSAWRWVAYLGASLIILTVSFARLYFGVQTFSELAVTMVLSLAWLVLLGVAYRRHNPSRLHVSGTLGVALVMFLAAGSWHLSRGPQVTMRPVALVRPHVMTPAGWWSDGWRTLPSHRVDFIGHLKQPFSVQWIGEREAMIARLQRQGWHRPPELKLADMLLWLKPKPRVGELPVLPQVHDGHYERVLLVHDTATSGRQLVLRLWKANVRLRGGPANASLWLGYVGYQSVKAPLVFLSLPLPAKEFDQPLRRLEVYLEGLKWRAVQRDAAVVHRAEKEVRWDGKVLLVRPAAKGRAAGREE